MIEIQELATVLQLKGIDYNKQSLENVIAEVDYYGNKQINYSEFLSATVNLSQYLTDQKLQSLFHQFDTDDSGAITRQDIIYAMQKLGHEISSQEIDQIMKQHDQNGNDTLSFAEFCSVFEERVKKSPLM